MLYLTNINLNGNELQNAVLQPLAAPPANPRLGQIYYDSVNHTIMSYNGEAWQTIGIMTGDGLATTADGKVYVAVVNSLDSTSDVLPLAAAQGKVLKTSIDDLAESLKSFYNKDEIDGLLSSVSRMKIEVVEELPTEGISTETIYLKSRAGSENNVHDEYIYVNDNWELIGSTEIDLTGYVKSEDLSVVATSGNYEDLANRIVRLSGVLVAGATDTRIDIEPCIVHSIEAFDAVTGERVIVDAVKSDVDLQITIAAAYENDINISVLISLI